MKMSWWRSVGSKAPFRKYSPYSLLAGLTIAFRYWDWSFDSGDLTASPIWDNDLGFGGDGKPGKPTLARGRCVEEGPFANTTRYWQAHADNKLHVYNVSADPHCFSRGFATGDTKKRFEADITPDRVNDVLAQDAYDEFFAKLELGTHNAVPQFISGDFYFFTAPNGMLVGFAYVWKLLTEYQIQSSTCIMPRLIAYGGCGSRKIPVASKR
jgi:tyrosinase